MPASFADRLRALVPAPDAPAAAWLPAFRGIAGLILNGVTLNIAGAAHRVVEIEIYCRSPGHPDTFTHGDPMQEEFARWYFHRSGGEYKNGSFKGLDIAFGGPGAPAGVLIRGVETDTGILVDGSCMCVDHVLARTGRRSIATLVAGFDRRTDPAPGAPLSLTVLAAPRGAAIHESPRVGLTLKRGVLAERARFLARPYRFMTEPKRSKKGRPNLIVGLHRDGHGPADIARITGSQLAQIQRTIAAYEAGKAMSPAALTGDLTSEALCHLLGACDAYAP